MEQKMTWEEMLGAYPNEWVAVANYEHTGALEVSGLVIAHHSSKKPFYERVRQLRPQYHDIAVRYTGQLIKNPEIPLLWQITHTD